MKWDVALPTGWRSWTPAAPSFTAWMPPRLCCDKRSAGARTQVSNLVAWVATIVTLLFLTPLFAPLPEAVLAALIIFVYAKVGVVERKLLKGR